MIDLQKGNTVRLRAQFSDFDGDPVDPDPVTFTVYDTSNPALVIHETELTAANRTGVGAYFALFTPTEIGRYQIEFKGLIGGSPALARLWIKSTL